MWGYSKYIAKFDNPLYSNTEHLLYEPWKHQTAGLVNLQIEKLFNPRTMRKLNTYTFWCWLT